MKRVGVRDGEPIRIELRLISSVPVSSGDSVLVVLGAGERGKSLGDLLTPDPLLIHGSGSRVVFVPVQGGPRGFTYTSSGTGRRPRLMRFGRSDVESVFELLVDVLSHLGFSFNMIAFTDGNLVSVPSGVVVRFYTSDIYGTSRTVG